MSQPTPTTQDPNKVTVPSPFTPPAAPVSGPTSSPLTPTAQLPTPAIPTFEQRRIISTEKATEKVLNGIQDPGTLEALQELKHRIASNPGYTAAQKSLDNAIRALRRHVQEDAIGDKPNPSKTPTAQQEAFVKLAAKDPILAACVADHSLNEAIGTYKTMVANRAERDAVRDQEDKIKAAKRATDINTMDSHFGGADGVARSRERTRQNLDSNDSYMREAARNYAEKNSPDLLQTNGASTSVYIDRTGADAKYYKANPSAPTIAGSISPRPPSAISSSTQAADGSYSYSGSPAASPEQPRSKLHQHALSAEGIKKLDFSDSGPASIPTFSGAKGTISMPLQINTDRIAPADQDFMRKHIAESGDVKATKQALEEHRAYIENGTPKTMKTYGDAQRYANINKDNQSLDSAFESGQTKLPYQVRFDGYMKKVIEVREDYATHNPKTGKVEIHSNYSPNQQRAMEAVESTVTASRYLQNGLDRLATRYPSNESISAIPQQGIVALGIMQKLTPNEHSQLLAREQYKLGEAKKADMNYGDAYIRATQNPSAPLTGDKFAKVSKSFNSNELHTDVFALAEFSATAVNKDAIEAIKNGLHEKIKHLPYHEAVAMAENIEKIESYYRNKGMSDQADFVRDLGRKELSNFQTNDKLFREFRQLNTADKDYEKKYEQLGKAIQAANPEGLNNHWKKALEGLANTDEKKESIAAFERCLISQSAYEREIALYKKFETLYNSPNKNTAEFKFNKLQLERQIKEYGDLIKNSDKIAEALNKTVGGDGRTASEMFKPFAIGFNEIMKGAELSFTKPLSARARELFRTWRSDSTGEESLNLQNQIRDLSPEQQQEMKNLIENEWPTYIKDTDSQRKQKIESYMGFREFFQETIK